LANGHDQEARISVDISRSTGYSQIWTWFLAGQMFFFLHRRWTIQRLEIDASAKSVIKNDKSFYLALFPLPQNFYFLIMLRYRVFSSWFWLFVSFSPTEGTPMRKDE